MSRAVVVLHTIEQWQQQDEATRVFVLRNIKLKDRLHRFLYAQNEKGGPDVKTATWVRCSKCADSEYPGWFLKEPRYDGIHPSSMGHPCLLKVYNEMIGTPQVKKIEPRVQLIFDLGHAVHHMFQTYGLKGAWGPSYKQEVEISGTYQKIAEDLMLEGHADAENILVIDEPGAPIYEVGLVHEYKSINSNGFKGLTKPKPEHKQQAMLYAKALNRPVVVYLYLNKDDANLSDFPVQYNPEAWDLLERKARYLKQQYDAGQPPKGEVGFHCNDCPFAATCPDRLAAQPRRAP